MDKLKRRFYAMGIGSVPYQDAKKAVEIVLKNFSDIPFWPQLPKRSFFENMYVQFMEGFPGTVVNSEKNTVHIDTSKDFEKRLEEVYQKIIDIDVNYFGITKERAEGFYELMNRLKGDTQEKLTFIKGQITGPISFGLSVTDEKKKAILYNPELSDLLTRILVLKIKWQLREIHKIFSDVIMFIDEPYLVSIGSSHVNIKREDAAEKIKELVDAIHFENKTALAAIHCCGNTDWPLLLNTGIDILNFDAYNYMESITLYPREIEEFLNRGGFVAWGIVPTSKEYATESSDSLIKKLEHGMDLLVKKGISKDKLLDSCIITPSCGCGTLDIKRSERVFELAAEVASSLRKKYS